MDMKNATADDVKRAQMAAQTDHGRPVPTAQFVAQCLQAGLNGLAILTHTRQLSGNMYLAVKRISQLSGEIVNGVEMARERELLQAFAKFPLVADRPMDAQIDDFLNSRRKETDNHEQTESAEPDSAAGNGAEPGGADPQQALSGS